MVKEMGETATLMALTLVIILTISYFGFKEKVGGQLLERYSRLLELQFYC